MILVLRKICYNPRSSSKSTRASTTSAGVAEVDQHYPIWHEKRSVLSSQQMSPWDREIRISCIRTDVNEQVLFTLPQQSRMCIRLKSSTVLPRFPIQPIWPCFPFLKFALLIVHVLAFLIPQIRCLSYSTDQLPFLFHGWTSSSSFLFR